ncbi:TspO/MBR family protein [Streptomyces sp. NPDC048182]|uniref:TspO/MBR family protein n=1 Tax=Streptomyces sp. NPDC048182 TaxID=3365507 RepID=UPI00371852F8
MKLTRGNPSASPVRRRLTYGAAAAVVSGCAAVGARATGPSTDWYAALDKPRWQPPTWAFPAVWTPLYATLAWSAGHALNESRGPGERRAVAAAFGADLALNAAWTWLFFGRRSTTAGVCGTLLLDAANVGLLRRLARTDRKAAAALVPYAAWCAFATALGADIHRRNR